MLMKYAELGHVYRGEPCQEYPGTYYLYHNGKELCSFSGEVGETEARMRLGRTSQTDGREGEFSLAWQCTEGDPRQGEVWFTGYYTIKSLHV